MPAFDERPGKRWEKYLNEPDYRLKRIIVCPRQRPSLKKHKNRTESWVIVEGAGKIARVELERKTYA